MSSWTAPISWPNAAVSAATMNTEIRDHLNFLKGALDLLTNSTTADTGTTMHLQVRRTASGDTVFEGQVGAEANPRIRILASGKVGWGPGGAGALDAFLERSAAGVLKVSGDVQLRVEFAAVPVANQTAFGTLVAGDAASRFRAYLRPDGGAGVQLGAGGSPVADIYWDQTAGVQYGVWDGTGSLHASWTHFFRGTSAKLIGFGRTVGTGDVSIGLGPSGTAFLQGPAAASQVIFQSWGWQLEGQFLATDGSRFYTKAGTISDGDFTTAATGLAGLDTTNGHLYVREGSTWRKIDVRGSLHALGPFTYTNLAASQSGLIADYGGMTAQRVPVPWAGSVVGIAVRSSAAITGNSATFKPNIAGSAGTLSVQLNTVDTPVNSATQAAGIDTFTSSQTVGVEVTTTAGFLPAGSAEMAVYLWVLMNR